MEGSIPSWSTRHNPQFNKPNRREEGVKHIKAIAVAEEEKFVRVEFSEAQQLANREAYVQASIELAKLNEELAAMKAAYKEKIDPVKSALAEALEMVRQGYTEEKKTLYLVPDFDLSMMRYCTEDGEVVESRRLLPSERQENFLRQIAVGLNEQ
jgi:hypothetical protein